MITPTAPLILCSGSPRRRDMLQGLGIPLLIRAAPVPEVPLQDEAHQAFLERVVREKLSAAAALVERELLPSEYGAILVADTIVVIEGRVLGKPTDTSEAALLLGQLVARTHTVYTRYAVAAPPEPARALAERTARTDVTMRSASAAEVQRYAETGEGLDKAGAYAAQGIGAFLLERIDGSYANVVGLPVCELVRDLCRLGLLEHFP